MRQLASLFARSEEGVAQLQLLLARITQNRKNKAAKKKQAMIQVT